MPSVLQPEHNESLAEEQLKNLKWRRRFYAAVFIVLLGVIIYFTGQLLNALSAPVGIIIWSAIIVFCLRSPVNWLEAKGVARVWGTAISYVLMFVVLGLIALLMFSPFFDIGAQFSELVQSVPGYVETIQKWINELYENYSYLLQDDTMSQWANDAVASFGAMVSEIARSSTQSMVDLGSGIASTLLVIGFSLVVAFWVLMELPAMGREIHRLIGPRHREDLDMLYLTGTRVMGGYIKGTLVQCLLIGIFAGIGFAIMGIPNALALAIITGILNIIPVIGPWFGGAMAALVGLFISPVIALIAFVYTIVVQQLVYTFISPRIMGDSVDIHPALVILALMIGSALGYAMSGFMGSFLGALASIPAVAALKAIFIYYFEKRTGRVIVATDGVIFKGEPVSDTHNPVADATGEISAAAVAAKLEEGAAEAEDELHKPAVDPFVDATATGQFRATRKLDLPGSDLSEGEE